MLRVAALPIFAALLLAGCAADPAGPEAMLGQLEALPPADVLLLGEQHDAPDHQQVQRRVVESLAGRGRLAALALEMAEQGTSTARLTADADEAAVRDALRWDQAGWPWQAYGPTVMAAVRAGVPVLGANLPRSQLRSAMTDGSLDTLLPGPALKAQQQAIRLGHCGLLPESQVGPMTRVQVARDRAMAQTLAQGAIPGKTVVLLAGAGHVDEALGVPRHLPASLRTHAAALPARASGKDYCAELRLQMRKPDSP
jgi:uncharacterized iron-regulated protein